MKYLVQLSLFIFSHLALANSNMHMTGVGLYSDLRAEYFYGALYTEVDSVKPSAILSTDGAVRMEMKVIAKSISKRRFYKLMNEMIAISNSGKNIEYHANSIIQFTDIVDGKLEAGDHVVIDNSSGNTRVSINDVPVLVVEDKQFINVLLNGWIGRLPPTADFKKDLLASTNSPHYQAYLDLAMHPGRKVAIESWNTPIKIALQEKLQEEKEEQEALQLALLAKQKVIEEQRLKQAELQKKANTKEPKSKESESSETDRLVALLEKKKQQEKQARLDKIKKDKEMRLAQAKQLQLAESNYFRKLIRKANKAVVYPKKAYERGEEGYVKIRITIDKEGMIQDLETVQSSNTTLLDKAALYSAKKAEPFPAVPDQLALDDGMYEFTIPYRFQLN